MQPSEEPEKEQKAPKSSQRTMNSIDSADGRIVDNKATNRTTSYMALATG